MSLSNWCARRGPIKRICTALATAALWLGLASAPAPAGELVLLAQPGPWPHVATLIGYGGRLWFVNSRKFVNHNTADVYSYDPLTGGVRFERALFSQDAGDPVVAGGLLYWPFEDARFSMRHGEFMVTDGERWQWRILPGGDMFHVHAMVQHDGAIYAATSAWRGGLQRSTDGGATWQVLYDHPTPPGEVTRITALEILDDTLYAGLTTERDDDVTLLRREGTNVVPVPGWPKGQSTTGLAVYRGWLYALGDTGNGRSVWRTDGRTVERIHGFDGIAVRAFAGGPDALWAVSATGAGGALWRSADGIAFNEIQRFSDAAPVALAVYADDVYVGTEGPGGRGALWGPAAPASVEPSVARAPLPAWPEPPDPAAFDAGAAALDRALIDPATYTGSRGRLAELVAALAGYRTPAAGSALSRRLDAAVPDVRANLFGGNRNIPAVKVARWDLLWAIARTGHGRVPPELLALPWQAPANRAEKYFETAAGAAWAVAELGQKDAATLAALIARLDRPGDPDWLVGDIVGALSALTGERFGHDVAAWQAWWKRRGGGG
jgi:hypothetical protein